MNDPEPNPLRNQLDSLPREIPPARDLWPEVQARLDSNSVAVRPFRRWRLPLAIAAALALAATLHWLRPIPTGVSWAVAPLAGTPRVNHTVFTGPARLHEGAWLETDGSSRARVTVGVIGEVNVGPNSRLRLVKASATDHRLELARGTMSALIWAPPRLFFVETPSATAVDLGCAYTLTVGDDGAGVLVVTAGYVALEHRGREAIIPAGLMCLTRPGAGPGTPFTADASMEFRQALAQFDTGNTGSLAQVVTAAGANDAITLWHLLARAPVAARGAVFDKLVSFQPAPTGVTREGILAGDTAMRASWGQELGLLVGQAARP